MTDSDEPDIDTGEISFADDPSNDELRDYFAGQALSSMELAPVRPRSAWHWIRWFFGFGYSGAHLSAEYAAERSYELADAMLKQRGGGE